MGELNDPGRAAQFYVIRGHDRDHRISGVTFENVSVDGRYITSAEDGNFQIDPDSTSGVTFKVTKLAGR